MYATASEKRDYFALFLNFHFKMLTFLEAYELKFWPDYPLLHLQGILSHAARAV